MPVYHSLKTIFVRVPKTASTSISEKLHAIDAHARYFSSHSNQSRAKLVGERFKHEGITEIKKNITLSCFDQYYKIGFVRNPWDWLVSCYFYYKNTDLSTQGALSSGKIIYDEGFEQFYKIRDIKNCSFDEFITLVESATRDIKDGANLNQLHHPYQPQYKYLVDENENLIVDFVGKYEKLEEEWLNNNYRLNEDKIVSVIKQFN